MNSPLDTIVARLLACGRITPQDVMALRPLVWNDGRIAEAEADLLFKLNTACYGTCPEWTDCFVEAATAFLVEGGAAPGYVDDTEAAWLITRIDQDGRVDQIGELMLLVGVLEDALNVPDRLKAYAIAQIEAIVTTGKGPTRMGAVLRPGTIEEAEVALLRRIFFASGSDGAAIISDDEANALFRIKDKTLRGDNAPSWARLFVQLIGNHLMAHQTYTQLTHERAGQLERFMDDNIPNVGRFLSRMEAALANPSQMIAALQPEDTVTAAEHDASVAASRAMTADEAHWLKLHIAADGELDEIEKALLAFVIDESGPLPVEVEEWVKARA